MQIAYKRVSTIDQGTARQLDGLEFDQVYEDKASGKDTNRPELAALLRAIRAGDTVHVHSIDRLARNTADLLRLVQELTAKGVGVKFHKEGLEFKGSDDPTGKLMMTMLAAFAEFERAMIRERQREGIAIAKAKGVYSKPREGKLKPEQVADMLARAQAGGNKAALAREFGISRETLYQHLRGVEGKATA